MPLFRKKPVVVEALQWTGANKPEMSAFMNGAGYSGPTPQGVWLVHTLEGVMAAEPGDWIIREIKDEFYPCKPDIFAATYEPVEA